MGYRVSLINVDFPLPETPVIPIILANGNFIMTQDASHKQINSNHNLPLLKVPTGQNYSANLYGEDASTGLSISKTPLHYKLDAKVAGANVDVYIPKSQTDNLVSNTSITTPT